VNEQPVWHGSPQEGCDLVSSLANNCACEFGQTGIRLTTCAAHAMAQDQRALDGLVFGRFMAARLIAQEFGLSEAAHALPNAATDP
jgi:hypothetical protein